MQYFDYYAPHTIEEAVRLLAEHGEGAHPIAGGTDLLVQMRGGRRKVTRIVDVKRIPELNTFSFDSNGGLILGASVSCCRISAHSEIARCFPALADSASMIGSTQIQSRASIGGNLCNAAPSADSIPSLIVLGATCVVTNMRGTRQINAGDFCTGPGKTVLHPGEMLVHINLPPPVKNSSSKYIRFTPRNEMDIAVAGVGVWVKLGGNGSRYFESVRIALSAVAPTPLRVLEAEAFLRGKQVNDENIAAAAKIARNSAKPITDLRGTIEFRNHLVEVLTRRAISGAISRAKDIN